MNYLFRPIVNWPGRFTDRRKRSPFKAGYQDTLDLLDRELRHLGAGQVVFQLALGEREIRNDGRPYRGGDAEKFKLVQQAKEILEPLAPQ